MAGDWPGLSRWFPPSLWIYPEPLEERWGMTLGYRAVPSWDQGTLGDVCSYHNREYSWHLGGGDGGCSDPHSAQNNPHRE